jgi:hypothetical protein
VTELDAFILALDEEMKMGQRSEQALRKVVTERAEQIRERIKEGEVKEGEVDEGFGD